MAPKWSALKNIPKEMRALPQWVCYKAVPRKGHWGKIIQSPVTQEAAKSNCPSDWTDFETALAYAQNHNMDGVTFVLTGGIVFIDLDEIDEKPQEVRKQLSELCKRLDGTYCESSVSGRGIHFFCKGTLPENARKKNERLGLEMYETGRFACMSGNVIGGATGLKDLSDRIGEINRQYIGEPYREISIERRPATASDMEIIDAIRSSKQGAKFERLYGGDWSGYESHSSADFALLKMLSFWTQDETQLDSIFRSSGLYRPKWDKCNGSLRLTTATRKNSMEM